MQAGSNVITLAALVLYGTAAAAQPVTVDQKLLLQLLQTIQQQATDCSFQALAGTGRL